jgi:hypothetical protein
MYTKTGTLIMTPEELEALHPPRPEEPDKPGRWLFQYEDGPLREIRFKWVDLNEDDFQLQTSDGAFMAMTTWDFRGLGTWKGYLGSP